MKMIPIPNMYTENKNEQKNERTKEKLDLKLEKNCQ